MLDNYLLAIETMDEALMYCQYVESCCFNTDFLDSLDIAIEGTNWNEPKSALDFNNVAVMALIAADNSDDSNEKRLYLEYATESLKKGIDITNSLLCKAHLAIVCVLTGELDKAKDLAYRYLSESLQSSDSNNDLGLIYLPRHSLIWKNFAQTKLPEILTLSDGNSQALSVMTGILYQVQADSKLNDYRILLVVSGGLKEFVKNTVVSIINCNIDPQYIEIFTPESNIEDLLELRSQYGIGNVTAIEDIVKNIDLQNNNNYHNYGTGEFGKFTLSKWIAIKHLLNQGVKQVVYTDVDIAWRQNPLPLLQQIAKHYSLSIQTEGTANFPPHLCTGFMSFVNNDFSHRLLDSLTNLHSHFVQTNPEYHDQTVINHLIQSSPYLLTNIFSLSELLFANGMSASLLSVSDPELSPIQSGQPSPMIFHANWTVGLQNKKYMLQKTGNWFLEEKTPQPQAKKYKVANHEILLPIDHMLDRYQSRWKRYDTVLGNISRIVFTKYSNSTAIDIGANVGDSAALINKYVNVPILCIEGHSDFIPFLKHNASIIGNIQVAPYFIGEDDQTVSLDSVSSKGGTASITSAITSENPENNIKLKSLKSILDAYPQFRQPKLLKIDCDGFDFEIILDSIETIKSLRPVICFEYDISFRSSGINEAISTIDKLIETDYSHFLIYDNFGNYLISIDYNVRDRFDDLNHCLKCNRYQSGEVAIYYLDVYAFHRYDYDLFIEARKMELLPS
jgi:FkbM family methyltransferase